MTNETTTLNLALYDDVEIQPVAYDKDGDYHEPLPYDEKDKAVFWTVYGHLKTGGVDALVDCVDEENAERCGAMLAIAMQMLDALQLAQRALNTAPRFRVDDTDSYEIAAKVDAAIAKASPLGRH